MTDSRRDYYLEALGLVEEQIQSSDEASLAASARYDDEKEMVRRALELLTDLGGMAARISVVHEEKGRRLSTQVGADAAIAYQTFREQFPLESIDSEGNRPLSVVFRGLGSLLGNSNTVQQQDQVLSTRYARLQRYVDIIVSHLGGKDALNAVIAVGDDDSPQPVSANAMIDRVASAHQCNHEGNEKMIAAIGEQRRLIGS